jgi:hypothetical protein
MLAAPAHGNRSRDRALGRRHETLDGLRQTARPAAAAVLAVGEDVHASLALHVEHLQDGLIFHLPQQLA